MRLIRIIYDCFNLLNIHYCLQKNCFSDRAVSYFGRTCATCGFIFSAVNSDDLRRKATCPIAECFKFLILHLHLTNTIKILLDYYVPWFVLGTFPNNICEFSLNFELSINQPTILFSSGMFVF